MQSKRASTRLIRSGIWAISLTGFAAAASLNLIAQQQATPPAALTAGDYARAEKFMGYNTTPLVLHSGVHATWLPDDRFWYRTLTEKGSEAVLIDPASAARSTCDLPACVDRSDEGGRGGRGNAPLSYARSPDGTQEAFIRDWNLWIRDVATGKETALTTDGVKDFGYATDNAGWQRSDHPIVHWSPDSKKIATFQQDQREVGEMYLVDTKVGHPTLQAWKYPLPGDKVVTMIQRVIIDVAVSEDHPPANAAGPAPFVAL